MTTHSIPDPPSLGSTQVRFRLEGKLGRITLEGPVRVALLRDLELLLAYLSDHVVCTDLLIEGSGDRLLEGISIQEFDATRPLDVHGFHRWEKLLRLLECLPMRTLVLAHGTCEGAAFQLVLACDVRLAHASARFRLDEVARGFLPGMATWRLGRYVGLGRARRLVLQGETIDAHTALEWGLLDALVTEAPERVLETFLAIPAPQPAHMLARRLLLEASAVPYEDAVGNFLAAQHRAILAPEFQQGLGRRDQEGGGRE